MRVTLGLLLVAGVVLFLYLYHVRPRTFDTHGRKRGLHWPAIRFVDWYLKVSTIGLFLAAVFWNHPALLEVHDNLWLLGIGLVIAGAGLVFFYRAMRFLDKQYTPCYDSHLPSSLVTSGPYRFVRHPVYSANIVLLTGLIIASGSLWLVLNLFIMLGYYLPIVSREEAAIAQEFPQYRDYCARTGRFLPRLRSLFGRRHDRAAS